MNISAAQAEAIKAATSTATFSDGDTDYLAIITRLNGNEGDPGFFMDTDWVTFIPRLFPEWVFVDGDGGDGQGPWFASWSRLSDDDPGIWVALARRPHIEEE